MAKDQPKPAVNISEELSLTKVRRFSSLTIGNRLFWRVLIDIRFTRWKRAGRFALFCFFVGPLIGVAEEPRPDECVVLLHGLARTAASMNSVQKHLQANGYQVVNQGYPSRRETIETLAAETIPEALARCPKDSKVHFVTHSMGGILLRAYLSRHELSALARVVMLGPPNEGSEIVDYLGDLPGFGLLNGPAGKQLGTAPSDVPKTLGPVRFQLGVIAGTRTLNPLLSQFLPNPDDGKVSVASTKVEGMSDFIALPVSHPLMMNNAAVMTQISAFLEMGRFNDGQKPATPS